VMRGLHEGTHGVYKYDLASMSVSTRAVSSMLPLFLMIEHLDIIYHSFTEE
jgi:hypothetical protein